MSSATTESQPPCPRCHGVGTLLVSLCCGRGCATCPGDGLFRHIECHRCAGTGQGSAGPCRGADER